MSNANMHVFTTKEIIDKSLLITNVVHDHEGDWQFFSKDEEPSEENGRIVSLGEILEMDSTIDEILWLPKGMEAWRNSSGDKWITAVYSP